jgi:hypothetical protein
LALVPRARLCALTMVSASRAVARRA